MMPKSLTFFWSPLGGGVPSLKTLEMLNLGQWSNPSPCLTSRIIFLLFFKWTLPLASAENTSDFDEYESFPSEVSIKRYPWSKEEKECIWPGNCNEQPNILILYLNEWFRLMSLRCSREISAPRRNTPWLRRSWSRAGGQWTRCWPAPGSPTAPVTTARPSSPRATRRGSSTCCSPCPWCSSGSSTSQGQSRSRKGSLNF